MIQCPCFSGKSYQACCQKYHLGERPKEAVLLMRSRYSAYALGKADYIIETTHPQNPHFRPNIKKWKEEILQFSQRITFQNLEILGASETGEKACVVFIATLKEGGKDCTFTERSFFEKLKKQWLYRDGELFGGKQIDLKPL